MAGRKANLKIPLTSGAAAFALIAATLALREKPEAPSPSADKFALRVGDQADHGRTLSYYPEHLAALASIRSFQPVAAWRTPEPPRTPVAARSAAQPPRPVALKPAPHPAPARAEAQPPPVRPRPATLAGIELPGFAPTGDDIRKGVSGVGDGIGAIGDRIVDMGRSVGRLMRLSSR